MTPNIPKSSFTLFSFIFIPALVGGTAIGVSFAAVSWILQNISGKVWLVALSLSLSTLTVILVAPLLGYICKRYQIKYIFTIIYGISTLYYGIFWFVEGWLQQQSNFAYIVVIISFLLTITIVKNLDIIARTSYVRYNFHPNDFRKANSLLEVLRQGITFIVGGCSYLFLQNQSLNRILQLGVILFLLAFLCSFKIQWSSMPEINREENSRKSILNGLRFFGNDRKSGFLFLHTIMPNLCVLVLNSLHPKLILLAGMDKEGFAIIVIFYGLGALVASNHYLNTLISRIFSGYYSSLGRCYAISTIGFISVIILAYLYPVRYVIYIVIFGTAFFHVQVRIFRISQIMNQCHAEHISSVIAASELLLSAASIVILSVLGFISDTFGFWQAWLFVASLNLLGLFSWTALSLRRISA